MLLRSSSISCATAWGLPYFVTLFRSFLIYRPTFSRLQLKYYDVVVVVGGLLTTEWDAAVFPLVLPGQGRVGGVAPRLGALLHGVPAVVVVDPAIAELAVHVGLEAARSQHAHLGPRPARVP